MTFIWGQFCKRNLSHQSLKLAWKITYLKFHSNLPGVNVLNKGLTVTATTNINTTIKSVNSIIKITRSSLQLRVPSPDLQTYVSVTWRAREGTHTIVPVLAARTRFLSLAQSKLRLCSANHRAGYFSNLACDWLSIVWAFCLSYMPGNFDQTNTYAFAEHIL